MSTRHLVCQRENNNLLCRWNDEFPRNVESACHVIYIWTNFYDYFPFGCGLGSFGTFASAEYYSPIYEMYGLNHIWGLSKNMPIFICDAFYPELAQFGIIGAILYFFSGIQLSGNQLPKTYKRVPVSG